MEQPDHLKIADMGLSPSEGVPAPPRYRPPMASERLPYPQQSIDTKYMKYFWVLSSFILLGLNTAVGVVSVLDMVNKQYNYNDHALMSSVFLATIGGLAIIHSWLIKK